MKTAPCVPDTAPSGAYHISLQVFSLSCIHQILPKDFACHTQHFQQMFPLRHPALVYLTLLPTVHAAFPNKCLACHAYTKAGQKMTHPVMNTAFPADVSCHASSICVPSITTSGAHGISQQIFSLPCILQKAK